MKRLARSLLTIGSLALAAVAMTPTAHAQSASDEPDVTGSAAEPLHHHAAMRLFEDALNQLTLRPDQKAQVEELKSAFKARHEAVHAARKNLMNAVADQIEAGSVDRCRLEPQLAALGAAMQSARPGDREAFERLHSILDPSQRSQFVDALKEQWETVKKAHEPGKWLDEAAETLKLTPDQRSRIETILKAEHEKREADPDHAAKHEAWKKVLEAFRGERFVLNEIVPSKEESHPGKKMSGVLLETVEAIVPILTPEQRTIAANKLRGKEEPAPSPTPGAPAKPAPSTPSAPTPFKPAPAKE